jgi:hypothetical protein
MGVDVGVMWNDDFGAKWNCWRFLNDITYLLGNFFLPEFLPRAM